LRGYCASRPRGETKKTQKVEKVEYKAIEVIPEPFNAIINESGKIYQFGLWSNACEVRYFDTWGDKVMGKVISEIGTSRFLSTVAFWMLSDEGKKDFIDAEDFRKKLIPYYTKKSDLESKILKAMAIGTMQVGEEGADISARFSATPDNAARRIYREAAKDNWLKRFRNFIFKSKTDADKTV
jgi:hypothetical protein